MDIYVTAQGDTWDLLAYQLYGAEKYMQLLIEANWELLDVLVFSSGTEIYVPDMPDDEEDEDAPFWRQEDEDEDEYYYSSVDEVDEDE